MKPTPRAGPSRSEDLVQGGIDKATANQSVMNLINPEHLAALVL
ncbi:hypothetical protein [Pseudarthrobacter sulfonivorans]|nr:hypothetical protein [Pseudarthrobacter sulfonivorans]MDR6417743.1 hypothetical protein [Pseudarthrobacter sulfonivorans]